MGCVRDLITLKMFTKILVEFQRFTLGKIRVVSNDHQCLRVLRNGLSHQDFFGKITAKHKRTQFY